MEKYGYRSSSRSFDRTAGDRGGHQFLDRYLSGDDGEDAVLVEQTLRDQLVVMSPAVFCELLSDPGLPTHLKGHFSQILTLETRPGYWKRTGLLRASVLGRKPRARLADALIAQSCIDHDVALITRDGDYRWFT